MKDNKRATNITYAFAFLIPVIVMITVFAILGIYPFGNDTIMTGDTSYQLVDYLSYYKTILFGNNDFSYSLSKNMGGEMAGFAAYYLYSPLNLLTLPFPKEYLFVGIGLIIIITPGLASLSMCYALRHLKGNRDGALIFSLCYGLSGYVIVYNELLYYYTNIILLPLIFLALRRMTDRSEGSEKGRYLSLSYILLMAYAVMNNYYTAYMICIFLTIYVIYYFLSSYEGGRRLKIFIKFAVNSLAAVCLSCVTLIPAVMSLSDEKDNLAVGLYLTFPPFDYFSKLYTGSFAGDFGAGMPNIYCGIIVPVLLVWILMNRSIPRRKRIWTEMLLIFFWADFCINTLNIVWHGFNPPIGFPYRQAFTIVFFCIVTVYESSDFSERPGRASIAVTIALVIIYSIYVYVRHIENTDLVSIIISAVVVLGITGIFFLSPKYRLFLLCAITVMDLGFNSYYSLSGFFFTSVDEYQEPLEVINDAVEYIRSVGEDDVYRMEKDFRRTNNDAMMTDYAGLTHFSSSEKKSTLGFMGQLGYRNNGNWAMYTGENTVLVDSILGIRYLASQFDGLGKDYDILYAYEDEECYIYKNLYALPIVNSADDSIFNVTMTDDPFENQEIIADSLAGESSGILVPQRAYRRDNEDGSVSFDIDIDTEGILYAFFSAAEMQDVTLYLEGYEWGDYFDVYNWSTKDLLRRIPGETVRVDLRSNTGDIVNVDTGYFAVTDEEALKKWSEAMKEEKTVLYKETSSDYSGSYDMKGTTLLFSLPMDKGWHLYIDDKEYEIREACGHMMGATVPSGKHDIELRFIPPGRTGGYIVSGITLFFLVIYCGLFYIRPQYFDEKIKSRESLEKTEKNP